MKELVQNLKDKAGLTDAQALAAVETVKEFIYGKIPPAFSGFVDTFFADNTAGGTETDIMP